VTELRWSDALGEWWHLAEPAQVRVRAGGAVAVDKLQLAGVDMAVTLTADLESTARGRAVLNASSVAAARLPPLLGGKAVPAVLDRAEIHANWDRGPVKVDGSVRASYSPRDDATYAMEAVYRSDSADLVFGAIRVYGATGPVLQGEGRLPLRLE